MRRAFIEWTPRGATQDVVIQANAICADYAGQGYDLTLRQLYYQFVARDLIPNTQRSYKRLGSIVDSARLAGLMDWSYIVDRTRNVFRTDGADTSPEDAVDAVAEGYARALWEDQPNHVEVWVEKEALAGVVQRAASATGVNYFSCRGYVSQSEMYASGRRFRSYGEDGKSNYVIHLGDHDPSGIDMTRDITERLSMFAGVFRPKVRRIALNMDQVEEYQPPPNFAKATDARFMSYAARFGDESWELDALDPATLNDLITAEVMSLRDEELWAAATERQETERVQLREISDRWNDVLDFLDIA
jgi:hypothetical protein